VRKLLLQILAAAFGVSVSFSQTFTDGDWSYWLTASNEATITAYNGTDFAVSIPSSLGGFPVKAVGGLGMGTLFVTSINLPDSVTNIGGWAFAWSSGLQSITIPDSVTSIGYGAFYGCGSLSSVTIGNNVAIIEGEAFAECASLTSLIIPDSVTDIGFRAFYNSGLTSVSLGNGLTSIGDYAFYFCLNLNSIAIPDSVTSIGEYAFGYCVRILNATISDSVTSIGHGAFYGCDGLSSVTIGKNVTSIGRLAFAACLNLSTLLFQGDPPTLAEDAFQLVRFNAVVYYLSSTSGWASTFGGLPTQPFIPAARANIHSPASGFQFTWTGTGSIPMRVRRASSPDGPWTVISTNNSTGHFTDNNTPSGQAFYQAYLP
jgi:hypothetical protein